jgi:hypothetical protein
LSYFQLIAWTPFPPRVVLCDFKTSTFDNHVANHSFAFPRGSRLISLNCVLLSNMFGCSNSCLWLAQFSSNSNPFFAKYSVLLNQLYKPTNQFVCTHLCSCGEHE